MQSALVSLGCFSPKIKDTRSSAQSGVEQGQSSSAITLRPANGEYYARHKPQDRLPGTSNNDPATQDTWPTTKPDAIGGNAFACQCATGYADSHSGDIWEYCGADLDECLSKPCLNGAACKDSNTYSALAAGTYTCSCPLGYSGDNCATDVDECASTPCSNGGTCWESSKTRSVKEETCSVIKAQWPNCPGLGPPRHLEWCDYCQPTGYTGRYVDQPGAAVGKYACECGAGYLGNNCATDVDECASVPCKNAGALLRETNKHCGV